MRNERIEQALAERWPVYRVDTPWTSTYFLADHSHVVVQENGMCWGQGPAAEEARSIGQEATGAVLVAGR